MSVDLAFDPVGFGLVADLFEARDLSAEKSFDLPSEGESMVRHDVLYFLESVRSQRNMNVLSLRIGYPTTP
ncbi:MAG: hypothetical protein HYT87_15515 [Nitrospirae bacterium]|nr:hypothetical protein [Nitrospirota bacterium]